MHEFDETLKDTMSSITNVDFTEDSWALAILPARSGGLGIHKSSDIALPCYISSALSAHSLVEAILSSVTDLAPFEVSAEIDMWKASGERLVEPRAARWTIINGNSGIFNNRNNGISWFSVIF